PHPADLVQRVERVGVGVAVRVGGVVVEVGVVGQGVGVLSEHQVVGGVVAVGQPRRHPPGALAFAGAIPGLGGAAVEWGVGKARLAGVPGGAGEQGTGRVVLISGGGVLAAAAWLVAGRFELLQDLVEGVVPEGGDQVAGVGHAPDVAGAVVACLGELALGVGDLSLLPKGVVGVGGDLV